MKKVLLLGGAGFLGTHIGSALRKLGYEVLVMSRNANSVSPRRLPPLYIRDVSDIYKIIDVEDISIVVHLVTHMRPSSGLEDYYVERDQVNIPTFNLARRLAERNVKLVYISSGGAVYGDGHNYLKEESDSCLPISLYGQSKLECESHLSFISRTTGLPLLILRPSNPFGPSQPSSGSQGLVSVALKKIALGGTLPLWASDQMVRDYVYVEDAASIISGLIDKGADGVYNVSSGVGLSILDVINVIENLTGKMLKVERLSPKMSDVKSVVLSTYKVKAQGVFKERSFEDGVSALMSHMDLDFA